MKRKKNRGQANCAEASTIWWLKHMGMRSAVLRNGLREFEKAWQREKGNPARQDELFRRIRTACDALARCEEEIAELYVKLEGMDNAPV